MKANFVSEDLFQKHENEWLAIRKPATKIEVAANKREFFPSGTDWNFESSVRDLAQALTSTRN